MTHRALLRTIAEVRAGVAGRRASCRGTRVRTSRAGELDDLLLAPLGDDGLRMHLTRTIRCVRQRSLTDFLL